MNCRLERHRVPRQHVYQPRNRGTNEIHGVSAATGGMLLVSPKLLLIAQQAVRWFTQNEMYKKRQLRVH